LQAQICLREALSQEEVVDLASGEIPLISTLTKMRDCDEALGAAFPLSNDQLECLKLHGGDDAFRAMANLSEPPGIIARALETCEIDMEILRGSTDTN